MSLRLFFFVLFCFRDVVAVDLNDSTPCVASLNVSIAFNGRVTLTLLTERRQSAHEFWLFDFQSHSDAHFLVGGLIYADRTGTCSNARQNLDWSEVFDEADADGNNDFDPVSQSGLLDTFTRGSWSQKNGESVRQDELSYSGSLEELLGCRTSGGKSIFGATRFDNEVVLKTTAYATCLRPREFNDIKKGVYAIESSFPISIRVERRLTRLSVRALSDQNALSAAYYDLAFAAPILFESVAGSEYTSLSVYFFALSNNESRASPPAYYRMLNMSTAVTTIESSQPSLVKLFGPFPSDDQIDDHCVLERSFCKQYLHLSLFLDTKGSLAKAYASQREADKEISQSFDTSYTAVQCPTNVVTSSCQSLSKKGKVQVNAVMTLDFTAAKSHGKPPVTMLVYGLRRTSDMDDVTSKLVPQGEKLVLMSRIGPGEIRYEYSAMLTELTICRGVLPDGCDTSPQNEKLAYYNNSHSLIDGVSNMSRNEYKIYQVYFPMRGLFNTDVDQTITAKYTIEKDGISGQPVHVVVNQRVSFFGCPTNSEYNSVMKLCDCVAGYLSRDGGSLCVPDPSNEHVVTDSPMTSRQPTRSIISEPGRGGDSSPVVYITLTLVMMIVALYI